MGSQPGQRFPAQVVIGHLTYQVIQDDQRNMGENDGDCCFEKLVIRTSKELNDPLRVETTLHELLHAVFHHYGLTDQSTEEEYVNRGTKGILSLLKQNPDVLDMLIEFCT